MYVKFHVCMYMYVHMCTCMNVEQPEQPEDGSSEDGEAVEDPLSDDDGCWMYIKKAESTTVLYCTKTTRHVRCKSTLLI